MMAFLVVLAMVKMYVDQRRENLGLKEIDPDEQYWIDLWRDGDWP